MARMLVVDGGQVKRLMHICRTLCSGDGATVQQLQGKLRTSRRTIFRDLNCLATVGVKVELGHRGYRVRQKSSLCRKLIAESQTKALENLLNSCLR